MKSLLTITLSLITLCGSYAQDTFTDTRDGQEYDIMDVTIKLEAGITITRTWFAENMNYKSENSFCYKGEPAYCDVFGRLYTWDDALSVCPEGWHLSTQKEWAEVYNSHGGRLKAAPALLKGGASGLNLVLGGFGDPGDSYTDVGINGNYWDAEGGSSRSAGLITVYEKVEEIFHVQIGNGHRNSVRCVKNY